MLKHIFPILIVLLSIISTQGSSSLAKHMFDTLGPEGMAAWRLLFSALMLFIIFKPYKKKISKNALPFILLYGLSMGIMNLTFYFAIERIPIGIAVAIELIGPISVALLSSRAWSDFLWIALASIGLIILLPIHEFSSDLDFLGIVFALLAGLCWALYIVFGKKAGELHGSSSVAIGMFFASIVIFPLGVYKSGNAMFSLEVMPLALLVALLASALPYALDMIALPKLPAKTFSTLLSLSPVFAALFAFLFLQEKLSGVEWFAIILIIISSIGVILSFSKKC
ncbi:MAG: EamA family transporter [Campylobacteraceae bacterium]